MFYLTQKESFINDLTKKNCPHFEQVTYIEKNVWMSFIMDSRLQKQSKVKNTTTRFLFLLCITCTSYSQVLFFQHLLEIIVDD